MSGRAAEMIPPSPPAEKLEGGEERGWTEDSTQASPQPRKRSLTSEAVLYP